MMLSLLRLLFHRADNRQASVAIEVDLIKLSRPARSADSGFQTLNWGIGRLIKIDNKDDVVVTANDEERFRVKTAINGSD